MTLKKLINEIEELEGHKVSLQTKLDECKAKIIVKASEFNSILGLRIEAYYNGNISIEDIKQDFEHIDKFMKLYENNSYHGNEYAKFLYDSVKGDYSYDQQNGFTDYIQQIEINKEIYGLT